MPKICNTCKVPKPLTDFHVSARNRGGRKPRCNKCVADYARDYYSKHTERHRTNSARWHQNNRLRVREGVAKAKYGLPFGSLPKMYAEQGGACGCCLKPFPLELLRIDHCHQTGKVRSLLCHNCNSAFGLLKDSRLRVAQLLNYALRFSPE